MRFVGSFRAEMGKLVSFRVFLWRAKGLAERAQRALHVGLVAVGLALSACGGGSQQTLTGKVVDLNGQPSAGQQVIISSGSFKQTVVSDANGAFSVPKVPSPYTATIVNVDNLYAVAYEGLTRADPTLSDLYYGTVNRRASLSGQLTGGMYPEPEGSDTVLVFASPETQQSVMYANSGSFGSDIQWSGPPSTTGTLYALQAQRSDPPPAPPVGYSGFGALSGLQLADQGTLGGQTLGLAAVTTGTLSGTITAPAGYDVNFKSVGLFVETNVALPVLADFAADMGFSYNVPSVPNTSLGIQASAAETFGNYTGLQKTGLAAGASGLALVLPPPPALALPVSGATGVSVSTPFSWSAYEGGIHLAFFYGQDDGTPSYAVVTASATATIPDLASAGLPLPTSEAYGWYVIGLAPLAGVDALAGPASITGLFMADYTEGITANWSFTTAP
jgi:Carboxypeptidase regulatory-like domain